MKSAVRLYAILARNAPRAVVFRRGPTRQVLLVTWNTAKDTFEQGQWLKGRIYERRCDLSPNGKLLLYFAASYRKPYYSWSAICRPPFLTALALWPKGDGWGGGGHFVSGSRIALNHRDGETELAPGFHVPWWLRVKKFGDRPGWGEDDPVWSSRLKRDGWVLTSRPESSKESWGGPVWWKPTPPITWCRHHPLKPKVCSLEMSIVGIKELNGPWYLIEHCVKWADGATGNIGRTDWADWAESGDLLFARSGGLFRVPWLSGKLAPIESAVQIADFNECHFENREAPPEARHW